MNIDIKDKITLNNNMTYLVVSKVRYIDTTYFYLINVNNNKDIMFCELNKEKNTLLTVENKEIKEKLLYLFFRDMKNNFNIME